MRKKAAARSASVSLLPLEATDVVVDASVCHAGASDDIACNSRSVKPFGCACLNVGSDGTFVKTGAGFQGVPQDEFDWYQDSASPFGLLCRHAERDVSIGN